MTTLDVILVCPLPSSNDTNPPLGPAILASELRRHGLEVRVEDFAFQHLQQFTPGPTPSNGTLGDQGKDRTRCHAARDHFKRGFPTAGITRAHAPDDADILMGLHLNFADVHRLVVVASAPNSPWHDILCRHLFHRYDAAPRVLGVSVMGPAQLLGGLVIAAMSRRHWPKSLIVFGGSHISLLKDAIEGDTDYGRWIDLFMPGHCEREFAEVVKCVRNGCSPVGLPGTLVAGQATVESTPSKHFERSPDFTAGSLVGYNSSSLVLPLQLTRGCAYMRCTFCTYPAVELFIKPCPGLWSAIPGILHNLIAKYGVQRFSFKDSYLARAWLDNLATALLDAGVSCEWSACTRLVKDLSKPLLRKLHDAGCRTIEFGLETIHPRIQSLAQKPQDMKMVERVLMDASDVGIVSVVNLIYGFPGETLAEAEAQLAWFLDISRRCPKAPIHASHNLLEINRHSPMAQSPDEYGIVLFGIAPWAFSYKWNAPAWRTGFRETLRCLETANVYTAKVCD